MLHRTGRAPDADPADQGAPRDRDGLGSNGTPPPGRLELIRERARVICQRQLANIGRGVAEDRLIHDQEISECARALPDDWFEREEASRRAAAAAGRSDGETAPEPSAEAAGSPRPFAEAQPGKRRLRLRVAPLPDPEVPPRKLAPAESLKQQARLVRLPLVSTPEGRWMRAALKEHGEADRPRRWGECRPAGVYREPGAALPVVQLVDGAKREWGDSACPWAGCKWNLTLVVTEQGSLIRRLGAEDGRGNCVLEIAAAGQRTLEEVGELDGITRERVRQIEVGAVLRMRTSGVEYED